MRPYRAIPIGKPIKSENFVYGWLWKTYDGKCYILDENSNVKYRPTDYYAEDIEGIFEVIPSTVGQQVGLKDKNGKEIYEGDKLRSTATKVANPSIKICEWEGIGFDPFVADCEHSGDGWHWEIVGNIHAETEE